MKKNLRQKLIVVLSITIISVLHYSVGGRTSQLHDVLRLLYFIPIIIGSFYFGYKGGIITSIAAMLLYAPHILLTFGLGLAAVNDLLEVVLFFAVGTITGILSENKNKSMQKLDQEIKKYALLESYTKNILESIKSGIIAVNKDLLVTSVNQGSLELLKTSQPLLGSSIFDILHCDPALTEKIHDALNKNLVIENLELDAARNKDREITLSLYPMILEDRTDGLVLIIEDVTDLRRLQSQLQRNERLASLGELSAGIAHEIRNPLAIIKAIEQTIKKDFTGNDEAIKGLVLIDEEVERANKVVKSLMEFAKPSKHQMDSNRLSMILDDVLAITSTYLSAHNIEVVYQKGEDEAEIISDKDQLKQAFVNIIFNAVEAMAGSGTLSLSIEYVKPDKMKISFSDTGKGIEEGDLERIFNPFYTTRDEGTGLGLAIVSRIVEEHGGSINVSSRAGNGTTFELLFPCVKERMS